MKIAPAPTVEHTLGDPTDSLAEAPSADPWRRLMGAIYELIILFGVIWFTHYLFSTLTRYRGEMGPMRVAFQLYTLGVLGLYFTWFWSKGRRSLPMKTMSLQLVGAEGRAVSSARAFIRYSAATGLVIAAMAAGYFLSGWLYLLVFLPYLWTLVDPKRRALYDVLAGTRLVKLAPDRRLRSVDV